MAGGVSFVQSSVGARIAYTAEGHGPPLIIVPPWFSHLDAVKATSGYQQFNDEVARHHTVVHYDRWGSGLSDRDREDFSLEAELQVLEDVADHLHLRRFALMGPSRGGPVAVAFAHRQPRRVSHLILYGTGGGPLHDAQTWPPLRDLMLANWPAATRAIAALATQGCSSHDVEAFARLMQAAATPEMTIALRDAAQEYDPAELRELRTPTLVLCRWDDPFVSAETARHLAGSIKGARLEMLEGEAHPYTVGNVVGVADRITTFTAGGGGGGGGGASAQLTRRETEVLRLVAEGCSNLVVAERLVLSVRTVERHLLNIYNKLGVRGRTEAVAHWSRPTSAAELVADHEASTT